MFHLRPHRSIRSAVLVFSVFAQGASRARPLCFTEGLRRSIHRRHPWKRKSIAASAFLLASLLEFCGCNPALTCSQLRELSVASLRGRALLNQCQSCLTSSEFVALEQAVNATSAQAAYYGREEEVLTVRETVRDYQPPSFTEPEPILVAKAPAVPTASRLDADSRLQWPIPESVFFLYKSAPTAIASAPGISTATAFVLSVPGAGERRFTRFLVTARHVVDPEWAHCAGSDPQSIQIRLNKRSGGVGYENIPLESNHIRRFFTAADSTSDLAVIELNRDLIPRLDEYKFIDIPFSMLPTSAELATLQTTQPIMTAGLRSRAVNDLSIFPELNPGILATMPAGPIDIRCGIGASPRSLNLWFISASGSQGASGAPVYTFINRIPQSPGRQRLTAPVLLGVQSVAWPDRGLAGITSSAALRDLIEVALAPKAARSRRDRNASPRHSP